MLSAPPSVLLAGILCSALAVASSASAGPEERALPSPTEQPILTIEGEIGVTNADGTAVFDLPMLEAMGTATIETTTPWFDGVSHFEGVPAAQIMELVAAHGTEVVAVALNDYRTTIPLTDFATHGVILALKHNGEYMPVSETGPLFIVYPYDSDPVRLHSQKFYARSVWQLSRLIVR